MRDLKHMIRFENLLLEANNELVRQAKDEGKLALGYVCSFMPEVLLDLPGCFSVRLRAPRSTSPDMSTFYMSNRTCSYARCLLERALEGGYNFLNAVLATETCAVATRFQEHFEMIKMNQNENFFIDFTDVPHKKGLTTYDHYRTQLEKHVLKPLNEKLGVDTSEEALRQAIEQHNEVCRLITAIGEFRKLDQPTITGYEFALINLVSLTCPKYLIIDDLKEILEDLQTRKPDAKPAYRCKVVLCGSENDDPYFTKLIEDCGALVVADRHCYGSIPGREPIEIKEGETAMQAIARHYLDTSQCPRFMNQEIMRERKPFLANLAKEYKADGFIIEQMKFCEYWSYERVVDNIILQRDFAYPVCSIEKEYVNNASGQLRTRFQAFVESVEIKKIQEAKA